MKRAGKRAARSAAKDALLVIGYGNELRSDDGVGPKTAAAVAKWNLPGVRTLTCHQLTPELAVPIAAAERVVFIDASVHRGAAVHLTELRPRDTAQIMAHAADPRFLLDLARDIFGLSPSAYWLTIPIKNIDFGITLSPRARGGMRTALKKLRTLAQA